MKAVIKPPEGVIEILNKLKTHGYEAYAVGGCIRDSILGRPPKDWDIATSASPSNIKEIFEKTADTGLKYGTVSVLDGDSVFEVTTFRLEGEYEDRRRPGKVQFVEELGEDLRRRDFTMNALAWNEERGIVDPYGGIEDIADKLVRAVGDPEERFREDALRMLRAVRFAAQLGFRIHGDTLKTIKENANLINAVSKERVRDELTGILLSDDPMKLTLLMETGLMGLILPEIVSCFNTPQRHPRHIYNVGEHSLRAVAAIEKDTVLRWTMLLHDIGKAVTRFTDGEGTDHFYGHPAISAEIARKILKRLKFDRLSIERISRLIKHHGREIVSAPNAVAKAVHAVGEDIFPELLKVNRADTYAQSPECIKKEIENIDNIEKIYRQLKTEKRCMGLKDLAVKGADLKGIGYEEGKEIGKALGKLLKMVLDDPDLNEKDLLLGIAGELKSEVSGNETDTNNNYYNNNENENADIRHPTE